MKSRFNPGKVLDSETWLAHIVNTNNSWSKYIFGGHAALFVEGKDDNDSKIVCRYDILASCSLGGSASKSPQGQSEEPRVLLTHNGANAVIHNMKVMKTIIDPTENGEEAYQKIIGKSTKLPKAGKKIFSSIETFMISKDKADLLHSNALQKLSTFVKGLAGSFLNAKGRYDYDFFEEQNDLSKIKSIDGAGNVVLLFIDPNQPTRKPIQVFLDRCSLLWDDNEYLKREMVGFMKILTSPLNKFYMKNLNKLAKHKLLLESVPLFRYTGSNAFALRDKKKRTSEPIPIEEDRKTTDNTKTVNCMLWCRELLEEVDVDIGGHTNNPKTIGFNSIIPTRKDSSSDSDDSSLPICNIQ